MRETYEKFFSGGNRVKYVGIWKPALLVCDPEIARNVLVKDFGNFRNRNLASGSNDPIGALNVFTVNDPVWSQVRRRLTPVFTSSKLKQLQSYIRSKSKEVVQRIALEKGNRIDLRQLLSDFTTDVIGTSAFGIASDTTLTGDSSLRAVTKEFMKFSVYRGCC
ncbi:cytochrome P450 6a2-like [Aricia agestis]|uniref:cytochrome P450 6a2-like n=1 Tax=Aricia agestis TaxID=91739 RepID=UPI001C20300C|nr:cytochrome P450 6a2-like [Aricia agestis]